MFDLKCPICGNELENRRTDLPEYKDAELDEILEINPECAEEFIIDNTEEILWCCYCGRIE